MAQSEQVQHSSDSQGQGKRPRHRPWVRWVVLIAVLLLIAFGAIAWVESSQGSWFSILPVLIFTVLGVVFGLLQWLFPRQLTPGPSSSASGWSKRYMPP